MLVLTYHSVRRGYPGNRFVTTPEDFESQIRMLSGKYRFIKMDELNTTALPDDGALVTFDDGYEDNFTEVLPIVTRLRIPIAVFPATYYLGKFMKLGGDDLPCLSSDQIRQMNATGLVSFGSHTHRHLFADEVKDPHVFREDISESGRVLSDLLGASPDAFVYPKGRYNAALRPILEKNFRLAFRGGGIARSGCDPLQIPRIEILSSDKWHIRKLKLSGLYYGISKMRAEIRQAVLKKAIPR